MLIRVTDLNPADAFLPGPQSGKVDLIEGLVGQMQVDPLRRDGELKRHCLVSLCHDYRQKQHSLSSKKKKKKKLNWIIEIHKAVYFISFTHGFCFRHGTKFCSFLL